MYKFLPSIHPSWHQFFQAEFQSPYIVDLRSKLNQDYLASRTIYPPTEDVFRVFGLLPLDQVKVVILGQDPYHGLGQAHGLSFSVPTGVRLPPSLVNIYHEIQSDCQVTMNMQDGDLTYLVKQGVLLLNASLTVLAGQANSHASYGWHTLTDHVISHINMQCDHIVFILRGNFAKKKV